MIQQVVQLKTRTKIENKQSGNERTGESDKCKQVGQVREAREPRVRTKRKHPGEKREASQASRGLTGQCLAILSAECTRYNSLSS